MRPWSGFSGKPALHRRADSTKSWRIARAAIHLKCEREVETTLVNSPA
jgi:hypothetical protein